MDKLELAEISVSKVHINPKFSRGDETSVLRLASDIDRNGLYVPIIVRAVENSDYYALIDGSRRLAASKHLGNDRVKAIIRHSTYENGPLESLIVNIDRENLSKLYQALYAKEIYQNPLMRKTQKQLAKELGISESEVSKMIQVVDCPELVRAINKRGLPFSAAKLLAVSFTENEMRKKVLAWIYHCKRKEGKYPSIRKIEQAIWQVKNLQNLKVEECRYLEQSDFNKVVKDLLEANPVVAKIEFRPFERETKVRVKISMTFANSGHLQKRLSNLLGKFEFQKFQSHV